MRAGRRGSGVALAWIGLAVLSVLSARGLRCVRSLGPHQHYLVFIPRHLLARFPLAKRPRPVPGAAIDKFGD